MTKWQSIQVVAGSADCTAVFFEPESGTVQGHPAHHDRALSAARTTRFQSSSSKWLDVLPSTSEEERIIVVKTGDTSAPDRDWKIAGKNLHDALQSLHVESVRIPSLEPGANESAFPNLLEAIATQSFRLSFGSSPGTAKKSKTVCLEESDLELASQILQALEPKLRAIAWVEQPANLLTPATFAEESAAALKSCGVKVDIFDEHDLERLGARAILAVGRGSEHQPRLLIAEWRGDPEREGWDCAWVGKGLTFDGGGINLKSRPVIEKMKFDMGGAAAVIGALEGIARRSSKANVVAVVPMAENGIGSRSFRPGDVIRALSGTTIEVLNTDAEGRLVLADAITYAVTQYKPKIVIDVATLTGMVTGVLHEEFAGLYSNSDALANALLASGERSSDLLWRLPLTATQDYLVDSKIADVANLGEAGFLGLGAGSPTAGAKFIERFVQGTPWAHIDIAGTAWRTRATEYSRSGATGFGVALLEDWTNNLASKTRAS